MVNYPEGILWHRVHHAKAGNVVTWANRTGAVGIAGVRTVKKGVKLTPSVVLVLTTRSFHCMPFNYIICCFFSPVVVF